MKRSEKSNGDGGIPWRSKSRPKIDVPEDAGMGDTRAGSAALRGAEDGLGVGSGRERVRLGKLSVRMATAGRPDPIDRQIAVRYT
jgi:hypothetical protein